MSDTRTIIAEQILAAWQSMIGDVDAHVGIRAMYDGQDITACSHVDESQHWTDGEPDGDMLGGTSALGLPVCWSDADVSDVERVVSHLIDDYSADAIALIRGSDSWQGEDPGEIVIEDATVVASWTQD